MSGCVRLSVRRALPCGHDTDYIFRPITFKLFIVMRGGTLLILGHGVKGQGQLCHSAYETLWARYRLQILPYHFQTTNVSC